MAGCADELLLTPKLDPLPKNTKVEKCYFLLLVCLPESVCSYVTASLLDGFLGIAMESSAGLAALDVYELLSSHIVACSGAMKLMRKEDCPRKIPFDEQVFVALVLGIYKW